MGKARTRESFDGARESFDGVQGPVQDLQVEEGGEQGKPGMVWPALYYLTRRYFKERDEYLMANLNIWLQLSQLN